MPHTGSRDHLHAALRARRACAGGPRTPSTMPSTRRQNARATKMARTMKQDEPEHHAPGFCRRRRPGAPTCRLSSARLAACPSGTVGRDLHHLLPRLRRAVEILLAERLHDADVQQRLRVLRIELQRVLELRERLVRLVRVVVADAEIGADVDVVRRRASAPRRTT